jgi:hypothetical protein
MKHKSCLSLLVILAFLLTGLPIPAARASIITVTTTNDVLDAAGNCESVYLPSLPGPDMAVSLREAICAANNNPGPDTITFNLPGAGVHTISPTRPLPALIGGETTIDGFSQPGADPTEDETPSTIVIEINGSLAGTNPAIAHGLIIASAGNVIQGLTINRFAGNGINIINYWSYMSINNRIEGNHIGTNPAGLAGFGNGRNGVFIGLGAQNNTIGGDTPRMRNVLSGNEWSGAEIHGSGTNGNVISGNYIGTQANGMGALGNVLFGVRIYGGAQDNLVGGDSSGERNVISGNLVYGVLVVGEGTNDNVISGNYIGTTQYGIAALGNLGSGVAIIYGAQNNLVGGSSPGERNVISANHEFGVGITEAISNTISGNYIGTDAFGVAQLANFTGGVFLSIGAQNNLIGGDAAGERNIISGNLWHGVWIRGSTTVSNTVTGNYIGTNAGGTDSLPNAYFGVILEDETRHNQVGGASANERNIISGNLYGVGIRDTGTMSNTISGNYIGLSPNGEILQNTRNGILITLGAARNTVGGSSEGESNTISGNGEHGIEVTGAGSSGNKILGNNIGLSPGGDAPLGNGSCGVYLWDGANHNEVGPTNVVSANQAGVCLQGTGTTNNLIFGNIVGLDPTLSISFGNVVAGIALLDGAQNNTIGGMGPDQFSPGITNVIAGNTGSGVLISGTGTSGNHVMGNCVGCWVDLGNGEDGILITAGSAGNTIGPRNVVAFNERDGVEVNGVGSTGNRITQNFITSNQAEGIHLDGGGNGSLSPPVISTIRATNSWTFIEGTACAGCTIEIFSNLNDEGEGWWYQGSLLADASGSFSGTLGRLEFSFVTATAADPVLGTSQFSSVYPYETIHIQFLPLTRR